MRSLSVIDRMFLLWAVLHFIGLITYYRVCACPPIFLGLSGLMPSIFPLTGDWTRLRARAACDAVFSGFTWMLMKNISWRNTVERVSLLLWASMYILQDLLSVKVPEVCNASIRELIQTQARCERKITGKYEFFFAVIPLSFLCSIRAQCQMCK